MSEVESNANRAARADVGSMKETIESIVVAFILAFVFRAFVVEAFVIPTGSMAPTLLGKHVRMQCPMCGYGFAADAKYWRNGHPTLMQGRSAGRGAAELTMDCPMCDYGLQEASLRTKPGDRILVLKYVYALSGPRRWDVVVFRNPKEPQVNYIKRLVGLPNETIWIVRGNVYTRPLNPQTAEPAGPWRIQSKPIEEQRAVWQPIYHSRYVPLDAEQRRWRSPWRPSGEQWRVVEHGRAFEYEPGDDGQAGLLRFAFEAEKRFGRDYYPYNELRLDGHATTGNIEDLRIGATVAPEAPGGAVALTVGNERLTVRGEVNADGRALLRLRPADGGAWVTVAEGEGGGFNSTNARRLELWYVDQAAMLWVDDRLVARFDLPMVGSNDIAPELRPFAVDLEDLHRSGPPRELPSASVEVSGAPISLRQVSLDRDLYYTGNGRGTDRPLDLRARQYFVLGDNSPQSQDSRRLDDVDDWVTLHTEQGHGPGGVPVGLVPEKLMVGRAFFVYFPAPYALSPTMLPFVPNFGDMRFIE